MKKETRHSDKARKSGSDAKRGNDGSFMGIRIADPAVKPRGTTVREIRRAVAKVMADRKRA
jgi:hypothetical protein